MTIFGSRRVNIVRATIAGPRGPAGTGADRYPANAYSSVVPSADALYSDFLANWWDKTAKHVVVTDGSGGLSNGRVNTLVAQPAMWHIAQATTVIFNQAMRQQALGNAAAAALAWQMIVDNWLWYKTKFSDAELKSGLGMVNISDDAAWYLNFLEQTHRALVVKAMAAEAAYVMSCLVEAIPYNLQRFADTKVYQGVRTNPDIDFGYTTPGGIVFKTGVYGMLYAEMSRPDIIALYGYISTSFETIFASPSIYVWEQDNSKVAYLNYAKHAWSWTKSYLKTPYVADQAKSSGGIYYLGLNLDPNVANNGSVMGYAQPLEVYHQPLNAYFGKGIRGLTAQYDGGTIGMAALSARLYGASGDATYLDEVKSIADAFPNTRAFGRVGQNGQLLIGSIRDAWTNGIWHGEFARRCLTLPGVDPANTLRIALRNTAHVISASHTQEGFVTADWAGPEYDFATGNSTWAQESASGYGAAVGAGIASPTQIMTHSSSITVAMAASVTSVGLSMGSGMAQPSAPDDMTAWVAALFTAMRAKADVAEGHFGRVFFGQTRNYYIDFNADGLFVCFGDNRYIQYQNSTNRFVFFAGAEKMAVGLTAADFAVAIRRDPACYIDVTGANVPIHAVDNQDYDSYDRANNAYQRVIAGSLIARQDASNVAFYGGGIFGGLIRPGADNAYSCGTSGTRWSGGYFASGTFTTSDLRDKDNVRPYTDDEMAVALDIARAGIVYQGKDAIAEKGAELARLHSGFGSQIVKQRVIARGMDPGRYAFWGHDVGSTDDGLPAIEADPENHVPSAPAIPPSGAADKESLRYEELHSAQITALVHHFDKLEQRLAALEAGDA